MTDERPADEGTNPTGMPNDTSSTPPTGGWTSADDDWTAHGNASGGREWLGQLQSMIDNLATQAAPVARQVAAKAAELAAVAADKAGPLAHRAADATEVGGRKLAERSRQLADELRAAAQSETPASGTDTSTGYGASGASGGQPSGAGFESEADSSATTGGGTTGTQPAEGERTDG